MRSIAISSFFLAGCSAAPIGADNLATADARIANLTNEIEVRDEQIANLSSAIVNLKAERVAAPAKGAEVEREEVSAAPDKRGPDMCFKDYCPCDPPQGGPDQVLCDQLEQGIAVEVQLMTAGRGMREARRQILTGDY